LGGKKNTYIAQNKIKPKPKEKGKKKEERKKKGKRKEKHMARLCWAGQGGAGQEATARTALAECEKQSAEKDRSYGVGFTPSALYG
jgi:hypothetical protein